MSIDFPVENYLCKERNQPTVLLIYKIKTKNMKSINIATATMLFFFSVNAQTRSFPVEKIQNLLNKAEGKKYVETLGNDMKITKQVITADSYTFYYSGVG